jgi:hypothetical protein
MLEWRAGGALVLLALVVASCGGANETSVAAAPTGSPILTTCEPRLLFLGSQDGLSVEAPGLGAQFRPVLVGCAGQLATIDATEAHDLAELLRSLVDADIGRFGANRLSIELRRELAGRVNDDLGREVAAEVFLADFFQWEAPGSIPE